MSDETPRVVTFRDSTGEVWRVSERVVRRDAPRGEDRSLVFENAERVRRVRTYPANWMELGVAELEALSWRT